jgi:hypothetical protein
VTALLHRRARATSFAWLLVTMVLLAAGLGLAEGPAEAAGAALDGGTPGSGSTEDPAATADATTAVDARAAVLTFASGLAPVPNDAKVPVGMLPPGAEDPDTGPSTVIYPMQRVPLRFNHKVHTLQGAACKSCHPGAISSASVQDKLVPAGTQCDACHSTDHGNLAAVKPGDDTMGQCAFCHVGYQAKDGNRVATLEMPRANMVFNHAKHAAKNIGCAQCHGAVQDLELATRDQLPRMKGCFDCHQQPDSAARGTARSACETCHVRELQGSNPPTSIASGVGLNPGPNDIAATGGRIKTLFATGELLPPRWLHDAGHTPDFIERHKMVAAADSQFCANCHKESFCTDCHDGRVRPRSIHPNDYISMHPIEARQATQKCQSCHREQTFCVGCHLRLGIAQDSPSGVRESGRFHPAKEIWSTAPRKPGSHSFEAERNINACVSCHTERDCVACHGAQGVGGGFNPHRGSFIGSCGSQLRRNPRPCYVCHQPGDAELRQCR